MNSIDKLIQEGLSTLTNSGLVRIKYAPYNIDIAMSVVDRIRRGIQPNFKSSHEIDEVYKSLVRWFHGDPEFSGDLNKGFILQGPTGTGKTLAMQVMSIYRTIDDIKFIKNKNVYRMNFDICNVNDVVTSFINNAFDGIQMYSNRYVLCLDDLGNEIEQVKNYGNTLDVIGHIITERYSKRLLTFATTNYNDEFLEEKYGDCVFSRMSSLFNFIPLVERDFRRLSEAPKKQENNT